MHIRRETDKPGVVMIEIEETSPAGMPADDTYTKAWTAVAASIVADLEPQVALAPVPEETPEERLPEPALRIALSTDVKDMLEIAVPGVGTAQLPVLRVRKEAALAVPTARFWKLWNLAKEELCRHVIVRPADKRTWADARRYKQRWTVSARFTQ